MSVKLLEKQLVDDVIREAGETVSSDATTEAALVAFGKAVSTEQADLPQEAAAEVQNKKGGKE